MRHFLTITLLFLGFFAIAGGEAAAHPLSGEFAQGGYATGTANPGEAVYLEGKRIQTAQDGRFIVGFGRKAPAEMTIKIGDHTETLTIAARDWDIQRIDGLPDKKVTPPPETWARIKEDNAQIGQARRAKLHEDFPSLPFLWPAEGRISGVFGSQRVLNGIPKSPHKGLDIAAPTGTPIYAAADGVISLTHPDMYYTGKTLMIDHGHGLSTIYIHMNELADLTEGQFVKRGAKIGTIGSTGRSTGPHLHLGVYWHTTALDPVYFLPPKE